MSQTEKRRLWPLKPGVKGIWPVFTRLLSPPENACVAKISFDRKTVKHLKVFNINHIILDPDPNGKKAAPAPQARCEGYLAGFYSVVVPSGRRMCGQISIDRGS